MYVAYHLSLFVFVNIDRYINDFPIVGLVGFGYQGIDCVVFCS